MTVSVWIQHGDRVLLLREGETFVGRGGGCAIACDDPLVSRRHAKIVVDERGARVVDLVSANGVFVNGRRVEGMRGLIPGDVIHLGQQELRVLDGAETEGAARRSARAETPDTLRPSTPFEPSAVTADRRDVASTDRRNVFEVLGALAERAIGLGRPADAERILDAQLTNILGAARDARKVDAAVASAAAGWAVRLAEVTKKGAWVSYVFALYGFAERPLPVDLVDRLEGIIDDVRGVDLAVVTAYLDVLGENVARLSAPERQAVQRITALARRAAR